ncbi:MAG: outer membrane protein assembly factor BamE [Gammaproteobacteria bacterium]|nr:outer membrane protein assembly factor BamE [Gammaproteobacteria bacterium]
MSSADRWRVPLCSRISRILTRGSVTFSPALRRSLPSTSNPALSMFQAASRLPFSRSLVLGLLAGSVFLGGCVYRMTVQQGNFLDARQVVQVKEGMTRAQVRFLLGTPMLPDAFDRDRWDYLYSLDLGKGDKPTRQRLTIYFADDKVSRIENDGAPTSSGP